MKKLVSIMLSLSLLLSATSMSFAKDTNGKAKGHFNVISSGHGEYKIQKDSVKSDKIQKASKVKEEGIYQLDDGSYLLNAGDDTMIEVKKITLKLTDRDAIDKAVSKYNLNEAEVKDIYSMSDTAIQNKNNDAAVDIYFC